jgi:Xaa-Pro aminopeptidase
MPVLNERKFGRLPLSFSLAERDRRYAKVRAMMTERGFDALIVPCNTGHNEAYQADVRYLTQVGGFANEAALFFPAQGLPTCWVRADSQPAEWWLAMQDWVSDVRGSNCAWSDNFAASIRERDLEKASIGVVGIGGTPRSPDGLMLYGTLSRLQQWFPQARFADATEAMVQLRQNKSEEEIAALERATEIAEKSVLAAAASAKPGVSEHEVYSEIVGCMVRNGGELPTLVLWGAGSSPSCMSRVPPVRPLAIGDVIISEIEAKCVGYIAQVRRPIFVGKPSAEYTELHNVAVESFRLVFDRIRPGATYEYVIRGYIDFVESRGYKALAVPLHGRGLGEDYPVIRLTAESSGSLQRQIEPGQVFIVGPRIGSQDRSKILSWGDTVAVTQTGVRRLGKLNDQPIIVPV